MIKKNSLAKDFALFSVLILFIISIISLAIGFIIHRSYYNAQELKILDRANRLDHDFTESCNFITQYTRFLSGNIVRQKTVNNDFIAKLFHDKTYKDISNDNLYSWTLFDWITPEKQLIISTTHGILPKPQDMSVRSYLDKTVLYPGILQFSPPAIGIPSGQWIIPTGIGISTEEGIFLGTIGTGMSLDRLTNKLELMFNSKKLIFMMLDNDFNFILASRNLQLSYPDKLPSKIFLDKIKKEITISQVNNSFFKLPINIAQFSFSYFKHLDKYPFYFLIGEDIKAVNSDYWQMLFPRIAELSLVGILFIILLYYFHKRIITPILKLSSSAQKIAKGELEVRIEDGPYREINFLADQIKIIQHTKKQLIEANIIVESDNTRLEAKVKERTLELEEALNIKTDILNSVSHEVRTPVQGITSISQGLVEGWNDFDDAKKLSLATIVASNSKRLFSLVSNLLDLATFNSGKMHFNLQQNDLVNIIEEIIIECETLYLNNKPIKILFTKHPEIALAHVDREKISQVLRNIVTNAIKYGDSENINISLNTINITYSKNKICSAYQINVQDEGIGVDENELEKIFNPFIHSSKTKHMMGAGLGLAICKKIITGHHGTIWASSNLPQKGVTISFTVLAEQQSLIEHVKINNRENVMSHKSINILLIDDEPTCHMSMDILLSNTEYTLFSADGGINGIKHLEEHPKQIDLIFLDLMMPDMYGINVLERIKSNPKTKDIPVIIQTGTNDNKEIEKAINIGAETCIRKPYQRKQVLEILELVLNKKQV